MSSSKINMTFHILVIGFMTTFALQVDGAAPPKAKSFHLGALGITALNQAHTSKRISSDFPGMTNLARNSLSSNPSKGIFGRFRELVFGHAMGENIEESEDLLESDSQIILPSPEFPSSLNFTFGECTYSSDCAGDRVCVGFASVFCTFESTCYCLPAYPAYCASDLDCEDEEFCYDNFVLIREGVCISKDNVFGI